MPQDRDQTSFDRFVRELEPRLHDALSSALGFDVGREATAEALAYAWEHWARIVDMDNPGGYLYVVGRNLGRRMQRRRKVTLMPVEAERTPWVEPHLPDALANLPDQQRVVVMLLHCYQWTMSEAAEFLGVSKSTVQSHAERGMARLRDRMGVKL